MTYKIFIWAALILSLFSGCKKDEFSYANEFDRSFDKWQTFKKSSNNSYKYTLMGYSWVGSSWQTTLTVKGGKVVERDFYYKIYEDILRPEGGWSSTEVDQILKNRKTTNEDFFKETGIDFLEILQWNEKSGELGTKPITYSAASPLYTLDDIYEKAKSDWLKYRKNANITFKTDNNGMISTVGYGMKGCMDDCFNGVRIESIEAIK